MDTSFSDAHQASPVSFTMLSGMPAAEYVFKDTLEATGLTYDPESATMLLIDSPTGFALTTLETLGERDHLRVVVATGNTCPEYYAYVENCNGKFRDECLDQHWFLDLEDARRTIEAWRQDYNMVRPHSALDHQPPAVFATMQGAH